MSIQALWASLPPDMKTLLLGAGGELTATLVERALDALGTALHGTPQEQAIREAYVQAGVAFLTCLDLPQGPQAFEDWKAHVQDLLDPVFDDDRVQTVLTDAVLHKNRPEAVDPGPVQAAWVECNGEGTEATLPWREGLGLPDAVRAFARAFEHEAEARPELHTFLIAARLKWAIGRLETGVQVEGMEELLRAVGSLTDQQERLLALFTDLARMGYGVRSVSVERDVTGSVIVTGDNNQVFVADGGLLARLFRGLPDREQMLTEYRAHIRRTCVYLDLKGLALPEVHGRPLDPALVRISLDRVYIKLRTLPRQGRPETPPPPEDAGAMARYLQERQRRRWRGEERAWAEERTPVLLEQAVTEHAQLVILGAPGAGKSTFLRHLAWADAAGEGLLPLLVPLGRAAVAMEGGRSLLDAALDLLTHHKAGAERKQLRPALEEEIAAKRVHWLWDGLDEVRLHRREVVDALARLTADGHRMVVTSRPLGYEPLPGCDALYEVLPLQPEDARAFVDRWFLALAEARGVPEGEREAWAGERARWLREQLDTRPGLWEVAENPLILTFLAVLAGDEPRQDFPRYRKDLYARYVERLFTTWEAWRRGGEDVPLLEGFEDPNEAREVALWGFRRVALHLHRAYTESPEQATRSAVKAALADELARAAGLGRFQAPAQAGAIMAFWERAGLLDGYRLGGRDWLAFRHLTFQEYGTACALAETYRDNREGLWTALEPNFLDEEWAEVIALTLAHLENATLVLEGLLEANVVFQTAAASAEEQPWVWVQAAMPVLHAAAALTEGALVMKLTHRRVVDRLLSLACEPLVFHLMREQAAEMLEKLGQIKEAVAAWESLAHDPQMWADRRVAAAEAVGRLGQIVEATAILLALACDPQMMTFVRRRAAWALRKLDQLEEAATAYLALAQDAQVDEFGRMGAAEALGELGPTKEATHTLLSLARDLQENVRLREKAALALRRLGQIEETAAAYLALAQDPQVDEWRREKAAKALAELSRTEEATQAWRSLAHDRHAKTWVREGAAIELRKLGRFDEAAAAWLSLACDAEVKTDIRVQAAEVLTDWGHTEEAAVAWLILARDPKAGVWAGSEAVEALGKLSRLEDVVTLACDPQVEELVRRRATEVLGWSDLVASMPKVLEELQALAKDVTAPERVRETARQALRRLGVKIGR